MKRMELAMVVCAVGAGCAAPSMRRPSGRVHTLPPSIADPTFLEQYAATRRFTLGRPRSIKVVPDGSAVLFLRSGPRSFVQDLYEYDTRTRRERVLLTAEQVLKGANEKLTAEELARRERMRMTARGIATYELSDDGTKILVPLSGRLFVIDRQSGAVTELHSRTGFPIDPRFSPDGKFVSCVRGQDVYVIDLHTGKERRVTHGGGGTITNGLAEFVAQEEMGRFAGYWWSPDSDMIAFQHTDSAGMETMHIMDAMHPERPPAEWPYPRPGKKNAEVRLGVASLAGGEVTWIEWNHERYPYLATVRWEKNAPLTLLIQNREQTEEVLLAIDRATGRTSRLLMERDPAWINLDQDMPYWLGDGSGFLWTTERRGTWQLELRGPQGRLVSLLTPKEFAYKGLAGFDEKRRIAYVLGSDNPLETHLYSVDLTPIPAPPRRLTNAPGIHHAEFSDDCRVYVHTMEGRDGTVLSAVRDVEGSEIGRLRSVAEEPPFMPDPEFATVGAPTQFHTVIIRPRNFDPHVRYPVIVSVYGGPHAQTVLASARRYLLQQWTADHGFVVVSLDGRGTPGRGREWERVIKGDLIQVPLQDQVAGLQALGQRYPELDLSRVGIYGWSFGGYFSAMAVIQRPEMYQVGIAGAPVCDWLDYDTHYTERYMGLPDDNREGYENASVLSHATELERPLLIIHGTADDNVYFMHSLKMSNALFRAGKDHEFLPLGDFTHMVTDPLVTRRLYERIMSFLAEHLSK